LKIANFGRLRERLLAWFPEREFFMRSQGQVRFIKITSRLQIAAASAVVLLLGGWGVSMGAVAFNHYRGSAERSSLLQREAEIASAESRVKAYRKNLGSVVDDLQRRQAFLEQMNKMLPDDVQAGETVSDSRSEADKTIRKVSAAVPEAGALARLEARQLALVERMTRFADRRAARAEAAIRQLGLNPRAMLRPASGMGGPLVRLSTSRDGSIDPRFQRLGLSLARMDALENGLSSIPQVMPADRGMISSGFGYRSDPFTGAGAMHTGLDFRGAVGSPIHAAANGRVSFVGQRSGYGNVVEVSHGNGLLTRYAHMSAFRARVGEGVQAGDIIGLIGSSGRSTGPHLHFEVRINDRAVNPRPFLETAPHVLEEARAELPQRKAPRMVQARG
jgi:murein DD-endopeptidase MepM/ murein hydrolase activator NlpD